MDDDGVAVGDELGAAREFDLLGMDARADLHAGDRDLEPGRDVRRLGENRQSGQLLVDQAAGDRVAQHVDGHLDRDLLATAHEDQVDVLDHSADGITLDRLRQRELVAALDLQREQDVGTGVGVQSPLELATGQRDVAGVGAVAVQDGGHLAGPPGAPGATLAELCARFGADADLGHDDDS